MNSINWTKFCDLYVQNEHFKDFIVKNDTNCFHAGCLWYEVERVLRVPDVSIPPLVCVNK